MKKAYKIALAALSLVIILSVLAIVSSASGDTVYYKYYNKTGEELTLLGSSTDPNVAAYAHKTVDGKKVNYIVLESDSKFIGKNWKVSEALSIDLNGKRFDFEESASRFHPYPNALLHVFSSADKKGQINVPSGCNLLYANADYNQNGFECLFENVIFTGGVTLTDMRTYGTLRFVNCEVNFTVSANPFTFGHRGTNYSDKARLIFENCKLSTSHASSSLFSFGSANASVASQGEVILKGCTLSATGKVFNLYNLYGDQLHVFIDGNTSVSGGTLVNVQNATAPFGDFDGFHFNIASGSAYSQPLESTDRYTVHGYESITVSGNSVSLNGEKTLGFNYVDSMYVATGSDKKIIWHIGEESFEELVSTGHIPSREHLSTSYSFEGDKLYAEKFVGWSDTEGGEVLDTLPSVDSGTTVVHYYAVTERAPASIAVYKGAALNESTAVAAFADSALDKTVIDCISDGSTVVLLADATLTENVDVSGKLTIDLNGKTLTKTSARFNVTAGADFSLVGGKLLTSGANIVYMENDGVVTLSDIESDSSNAVISCFDIRRGKITVKDSVFNTKTTLLSSSSRGGSPEIIIERCEINASGSEGTEFFVVGTSSTTTNAPATGYRTGSVITMTDCTVNAPGGALYFAGGNVTADSTPVFNLINSSINTKTLLWTRVAHLDEANNNHTFAGVYNIISGSFKNMPNKAEHGTTLFGESGTLVPVELVGEEGYTYTLGKPIDFGFNISLYTDFNVNLYIRCDSGVERFTFDGVEYEAKDVTDRYFDIYGNEYYKVAKQNIAARDAAKSVSFRVVYSYEGKTVASTVNTSVISYASEIFEASCELPRHTRSF